MTRDRLVPTLLGALALAAAGCAGDGEETAEPTTPTEPAATTPAPTMTAAPAPDGLATCEGEEWTLRYPESWHVNEGTVVPACSRLHPEPFEIQPNTDARAAAVSVSIEPVPFDTAASPPEGGGAELVATTVDGLRAARLEYRSSGQGLWPEGTPIALYAVDLGAQGRDGPSTLVLDTIGVEGFDYERNRQVLDQVARTLDVTGAGDPSVIARYDEERSFAVEAEAAGGGVCLRLAEGGEDVCTEGPAPDQAHTVQLDPDGAGRAEPVLAGAVGTEVHVITAERTDAGAFAYLPVPVPGSELRAFAFPFGLGAVARLRLEDGTGAELRVIEPGPG